MEFKIRVLFNTGEKCQIEFVDDISTTLGDFKEYLVTHWPAGECDGEIDNSNFRQEHKSAPLYSSQIRLIHFGKLSEDKLLLRDFAIADEITTFHLSLKPPELKTRSRCCTII